MDKQARRALLLVDVLRDLADQIASQAIYPEQSTWTAELREHALIALAEAVLALSQADVPIYAGSLIPAFWHRAR